MREGDGLRDKAPAMSGLEHFNLGAGSQVRHRECRELSQLISVCYLFISTS